MARRSGRQEVTTEPVSEYDSDDASSGGMDLATGLAIFTFIFIVGGIILTYMELKDKYDVGKESGDPSIYKPYDPRLGPDSAVDPDDLGGEDEGGEEDEGMEASGEEDSGEEDSGEEDSGFDD